MRLSTVITLLLALAVMAAAAYGGDAVWKRALYVDVLLWVAVGIQVAALALQRPMGRWARGAVALCAGLGAVALSVGRVPGKLPELAFHDLRAAALSLVGLGLVLGAGVLGAVALGVDKRKPGALGLLAMALACVALRGWLHHAL